jgi:hypothetical protein
MDGTMPRRALLCFSCRCEVEPIEIAGGRVVVVCVACEAYGDAVEVDEGRPLGRPVELSVRVKRGASSGIR